jgi:hypothetical protein
VAQPLLTLPSSNLLLTKTCFSFRPPSTNLAVRDPLTTASCLRPPLDNHSPMPPFFQHQNPDYPRHWPCYSCRTPSCCGCCFPPPLPPPLVRCHLPHPHAPPVGCPVPRPYYITRAYVRHLYNCRNVLSCPSTIPILATVPSFDTR